MPLQQLVAGSAVPQAVFQIRGVPRFISFFWGDGFLLVQRVALFASPKSNVKTGYGKGAFAMSGLNSSATCKATRISQITDRNNRESQNPRIPAASAWRASSPLPIPASSVSKAVPNRTKKIFSKDISSYHRLPPPVLARCRAYVETKRRSASKSTPPSRRARGPLLVITPPKSNCKQPRPPQRPAPHLFHPFAQTRYADGPAGCIPRRYPFVALALCTRKREERSAESNEVQQSSHHLDHRGLPPTAYRTDSLRIHKRIRALE
ncbi:uncharacterized protein K441DRAFT_714467 [Cenococcum geophilum 1.58]|uniref:uncharacterized protein n=1 Tax=Cenococcum geophilum 1.58 TaxID=794803 RepID=UPI00358EBE13|nr:hypothetical protein K441DRAFT_714467 [Cenococcum geophilum 1.58]